MNGDCSGITAAKASYDLAQRHHVEILQRRHEIIRIKTLWRICEELD